MHGAEELKTWWMRAGAGARAIIILAALLGWAILVTRYLGFLMNPGVVWIVWLTMMVPLFWIVVRSPRA
jgi:hypothetical protein